MSNHPGGGGGGTAGVLPSHVDAAGRGNCSWLLLLQLLLLLRESGAAQTVGSGRESGSAQAQQSGIHDGVRVPNRFDEMRDEKEGLLRVQSRLEAGQDGEKVMDGGHVQMLAEGNENIVDLLAAVLGLRGRPYAVDVILGHAAFDGEEDEQRLTLLDQFDMEIRTEHVLDQAIGHQPIRQARCGAGAVARSSAAATAAAAAAEMGGGVADDVELVLRAAAVVDGGDDGVDLGQASDSQSQRGASKVFQRQFQTLGIERIGGNESRGGHGGCRRRGENARRGHGCPNAMVMIIMMMMMVLMVMVVMMMMMRVLDFLNRVPNEFGHSAISGDAQLLVRQPAHVPDEQRSQRGYDVLRRRTVDQIADVGNDLDENVGERNRKDVAETARRR